MLCLVFDTEQKAIDANNQISQNLGCEIVSINAKTGKENLKAQKTTQWANIKKIYNQNKWYIQKPENKYMYMVQNYIQEEFDNNWLEPIKEL